jgi:hypothetical protein
MAMCALETAATNAITGQCNDWGQTAKDCALSCAITFGMGKMPKFKSGRKPKFGGDCNSFPGDTLVHVKPVEASPIDAQYGKSRLVPINHLKVGDEVLATAEWKEGGAGSADSGNSYEKITDIFSSKKSQIIIHLTLGNGEVLTATQGHPFRTLEGWRDAALLKKGDKLILEEKGPVKTKARIVSVDATSRETKVLEVFNLKVSNAHTFYVGNDGVLVHNTSCSWPDMAPGKGKGLGAKAPDQVTPTGRPQSRRGQYVNDQGRVEPWEAHYDKYGRQVERTDYNAGNKAAGKPDIHHHTREYGPKIYNHGPERTDHVPGVGPRSQQ